MALTDSGVHLFARVGGQGVPEILLCLHTKASAGPWFFGARWRSSFLHWAGDPNSGPSACIADTLPTKASSSLSFYSFELGNDPRCRLNS